MARASRGWQSSFPLEGEESRGGKGQGLLYCRRQEHVQALEISLDGFRLLLGRSLPPGQIILPRRFLTEEAATSTAHFSALNHGSAGSQGSFQRGRI